MFGYKSLGKCPQRPYPFTIKNKSFLSITRIVQIHRRKNLKQIHIRNFRHVHITQIKNINILLRMMWHSPIPQHNQHQIIHWIIILIDTKIVIEFICLNYDNRFHITIVAVGVDAAGFEFFDGLV